MNPIAIVIPTLSAKRGRDTGRLAQATAGCETRLLVINGPKRGFTKTVNDGLRQLEPNEDVCILNDDIDRFHHGWLAAMQRALYKNKRYGIVGPSGHNAGVTREGVLGMSGLEVVKQLSFWCVLLKRKMFDELGLLDERFIHYASDNEYCMRATRAGWKCVWIKDVYLYHQHHGSGLIQKWKSHDHAILRRIR